MKVIDPAIIVIKKEVSKENLEKLKAQWDNLNTGTTKYIPIIGDSMSKDAD